MSHARSASSPPTTSVRPEHREQYARLCVAMGAFAVLPHAASRAAKRWLAAGGARDLEDGMPVEEAAAAALRDYEETGAALQPLPPSPNSPQRVAAALREAEEARGGRTHSLSAEERKAMLEAYGKTMLGPKRQAKVRLEPQDLVWSPLKPFMPPSKAKLRAPTTGLWVELSKLDKQIGEREAAEKRERKAAASAEFRGGLDGQLLEKGGDGASMRRARQAVAAAAGAEKLAVAREERDKLRKKLEAKAAEKLATVGDLTAVQARKQREAAEAEAEAKRTVERFRAELEAENEAKAARSAAQKEAVQRAMASNGAELAEKKRRERAEQLQMAEYQRATMERLVAAEEKRKADSAARLAAVQEKMARMSAVMEAAAGDAEAKLAEKADRERAKTEAEADARAEARLRAHLELEAACSSTMRQQMHDKHVAEREAAALARAEAARLAVVAREAAVEARAEARKRREEGLKVQQELQRQIFANALRVVSPDVSLCACGRQAPGGGAPARAVERLRALARAHNRIPANARPRRLPCPAVEKKVNAVLLREAES
jgi:hypothetical protein